MNESKDTVLKKITDDDFLTALAHIIQLLSKEILSIYAQESQWDAKKKEDKSPITAADLFSHTFLSQHLEKLLPGLPVLSEEGKAVSFKQRTKWDYYWLIDPLDGTKEFLKRTGEFTVNIALIKGSEPVLGALAMPVQETVYVGADTFEKKAVKFVQENSVALMPLSKKTRAPILALSRRSDSTKEQAFASQVGADTHFLRLGAATKFIEIFEGRADIYPRFSPVCEWDVAAGHALMRALGGEVFQPNGEVFLYNKRQALNNVYVCACRLGLAEHVVPAWSKQLGQLPRSDR